jgi:hypothetical protein
MADRQVVCITTTGLKIDCRCITHIGRWGDIGRITRDEIIRRIESKSDTFWVKHPADGSRVDVRIAHRGATKYLRTESNDTERDNLLKLPEC